MLHSKFKQSYISIKLVLTQTPEASLCENTFTEEEL